MFDGAGRSRRRFLKQAGEVALGASAVGLTGKQYLDGRAELSDRAEGTYDGANRDVLAAMAADEPVRVGIHHLDFGEYTAVPGQERPTYDWDEVAHEVERIVGDLPHATVEADAERIDVPAAAAEQGYGEEKVHETLSETALMPAMAPKSPQMVAGFHDGIDWLDVDDADDTVSTYVTGLTSPLAAGVALPKYGESFIDSGEVPDTDRMGKVVAHETVHHFGPRDDYVLFLDSGNGLMGSGDDVRVTPETRETVDEIYAGFVDGEDGGWLPF